MIVDEGQSLDDLAGLLTAEPEKKAPKPAKEAIAADPAPKGDDTPVDDTPVDDTPVDDAPVDDTPVDDEPVDDEPVDDEPEDGAPEPLYPVKIDGKEERVTLKEALAGYQRNADYTRKTQEVAEGRKTLDAELAGARQQRVEYANVLTALQAHLGAADKERTEPEWNALRASDPTKYATEWTDFQRRDQQRAAVKAEQDRLAGEQRNENTKVFRTYLDGERTKLQAALPVLKDPVKGPEEIKALRQFAKDSFGYSDAELEQAYDHRLLLIVNMARKWDAHSKALTTARAKIAAAPDLPEPTSRQPAISSKAKARTAQMKQLDRTGKIDDAVSLILA